MTCASEFAIVAAGDSYGPRFRRARVEKPSTSSGLHREARSGGEDSAGGAAPSRRRSLSRFETDGREPLWNGPPLNAAFAAQLIGQVLQSQTTQDTPSLFAAYRERFGHRARALDRSA
jgi:hypothetical protein